MGLIEDFDGMDYRQTLKFRRRSILAPSRKLIFRKLGGPGILLITEVIILKMSIT